MKSISRFTLSCSDKGNKLIHGNSSMARFLSAHLRQDATDCKRINDTGLSSEEQTHRKPFDSSSNSNLNPRHSANRYPRIYQGSVHEYTHTHTRAYLLRTYRRALARERRLKTCKMPSFGEILAFGAFEKGRAKLSPFAFSKRFARYAVTAVIYRRNLISRDESRKMTEK